MNSRKQRWRFFLINVGAFAAIFLLLGAITLNLLKSSAYRQTDLALESMAKDHRTEEMEIKRYENGELLFQNKPGTAADKPADGGPTNRFNTQVILWSKDGKILNTDIIGGRFNELQNLKLDTSKQGKIQELTLTDDNGELTFHSMTTASVTNKEDVAYVQYLANTNQITDSMNTFKTVLILCMIAFWLLSIGISYYISKMNMKPVLAAWKKQQEFVENASHELRTPLTIIQNSLQKLFTTPDRSIMEESETIAQALNETRRLTGLTSDLLTIARSDANEQVLDRQAIDPQKMIETLAKPFAEIAEMADKQFVLENFAKRSVFVDEKKIHQVLVILLDNALKYTGPGDKITLHSNISNDQWLLEVKNTGPSISDEDKKRIFERFYREERSRNKETGGYGLGLAIAQQLIKDHHGKLSVHDLEPHGVIFRIKLPVGKPAAEDSR